MKLTPPIILTLARVGVIPVFVALFFLETAEAQWFAWGLFTMAAVTDFLDGYIARLHCQISALGSFLDPVADKLLVTSALFMMVGFGQISGMVIIPAVIILCREILVTGLREYLAGISVVLPVSRLAKWKTTVQMIAIGLLILGDAAHPAVPVTLPVRVIGEIGLWGAAIITLITAYDYLRTSLQHMNISDTN
ncbi:MAG: CDP-diacylglycerol--glycerol-3-phosphate 3-phosphatidyltransferase [Pseudomonadota bacterium]|nr:CDP-diacylglycerol--glycerol-3-phosphate 3-phosphatidyltransferase [Pseudomonadota bacterium]